MNISLLKPQAPYLIPSLFYLSLSRTPFSLPSITGYCCLSVSVSLSVRRPSFLYLRPFLVSIPQKATYFHWHPLLLHALSYGCIIRFINSVSSPSFPLCPLGPESSRIPCTLSLFSELFLFLSPGPLPLGCNKTSFLLRALLLPQPCQVLGCFSNTSCTIGSGNGIGIYLTPLCHF